MESSFHPFLIRNNPINRSAYYKNELKTTLYRGKNILNNVPIWIYIVGVVVGLASIALWISDEIYPNDEKSQIRKIVIVLFENTANIAITSALTLYFLEAPNRRKQKHYEAFQVIDSASGIETSYARYRALQDLNKDNVSLKELDLPNVNLQKIQLAGADLSQAKLPKANLSEADLRRANLSYSILEDANLSHVCLKGADLRGSNLSDSDLQNANLSGADLRAANLFGADLSEANLSEANLHGTDLHDAYFNNNTKFPDSFDPIAADMINTDEHSTQIPNSML